MVYQRFYPKYGRIAGEHRCPGAPLITTSTSHGHDLSVVKLVIRAILEKVPHFTHKNGGFTTKHRGFTNANGGLTHKKWCFLPIKMEIETVKMMI